MAVEILLPKVGLTMETGVIEEYLVDRLRKLRGTRQYMFATRSPGLVVSADSEQHYIYIGMADLATERDAAARLIKEAMLG